MKKPRNGKVDLLKFIFSIVVIVYHFGNAVNYQNELFNKGYIAVEFFFIVSGYLFAKSLSKIPYEKENYIHNSIKFMGKKYSSFMPYHIFMLICTVILMFFTTYSMEFYPLAAYVINSLPDLFLIQMCGIKHFDLIGHEWYISAMLIVMFILTPVLIKYRKTYSLYIAPIASATALGYLYNTFGDLNVVFKWNGFVYSGLIRAFAEISIGCICYAIAKSGFVEKFNRIALIITECLIYILLLFYADKHFTMLSDYTMLFLLAIAVTISFSEKSSLGFLNNKFVLFLGKLSFPIYLTQIFVRQIIAKINWNHGYYLHCLLYVACVIAVSLLCILIMDNIMKLIHKLRDKNKETKAESA